MKEKMNRRSFIKKGAAISTASVVGGSLLTGCGKKKEKGNNKRAGADIGVAEGSDYYKNTVEAVKLVGTMSAFVQKGQSVAILANPQRNNPGVYTKPQLLHAAIDMAKEAGASKVACISQLPQQNWEQTGLAEVVEESGAELIIVDRKDEAQFKTVNIPNGIALKSAAIMKPLYDYDVLIDMPITKDHAGNKFTGTMKNCMGLSSGSTNRSFHKKGWKTEISAITHLDQCIADLNTVITPDLCITDATEFITTNGPFGPGEIIKPKKVIAGSDRVAMDSYACGIWGLNPADIIHIRKAAEHGLGSMDLTSKEIKEIQV